MCRGRRPRLDSVSDFRFTLLFLAGETVTTRHDFPLPDPPASVEAAGGFNYPNSNGFQYEADAIHKCIRAGRTSSDLYTTSEMMAVRLSIIRRRLTLIGDRMPGRLCWKRGLSFHEQMNVGSVLRLFPLATGHFARIFAV